jgi:Tfp pilus assembly pilus retraction ATPase PilT
MRVGASDIHIGTNRHPILRVDGKLTPIKNTPKLGPEDVSDMARQIMNPA